MEASSKTVAVLFSGGDAPGMNAFLRAFVRLGLNRHRGTVLGIKDGYQGLMRMYRRLSASESSLADLKHDLDAHP